jgi:galactose mutarotase-like enzyme
MTGEARTYPITWLGQPALTLETPTLRFVTVPSMGAKIVSLFDKRTSREWLVAPVGRDFKPAAYGAQFDQQDMSGWDEMFPTISACPYPVDGGYKDVLLPDHGEVWSLPWEVEAATDNSITLSTSGRVLPYRLTRTARVLNEGRVRLEFEALNTSTEPLVALWAAHPQFAVDAETRIRLPDSVEQVVNVYSPPTWGIHNQIHPWPDVQTEDGQHINLDRIGAPDLHLCRKLYLPPEQPVNWAALQQGSAGDWIRLSWEAVQVPYLGVWVDEGAFNTISTAALEPATGYYDSLTLAWHNKRVMHLPPDEPVSWFLDIELGSGALAATET